MDFIPETLKIAADAWIGAMQVFFVGGILAAVAVIALLLLESLGTSRRCRFWCADAAREVEVVFSTRGVVDDVGVRSCSAFDPPDAVRCRRRCVDIAFRRHWAPSARGSAPN